MESSLPVSELELETRSAISMRAETNPALCCFLDYVRIVNVDVLEIASKCSSSAVSLLFVQGE